MAMPDLVAVHCQRKRSTTRNIPFGEPIKDNAQVEERIRHAKFAVLNPRRYRPSFLNTLLSSLANDPWTLSFSPNCISVRISGNGVDDLSFVNLPGKHFVAYMVKLILKFCLHVHIWMPLSNKEPAELRIGTDVVRILLYVDRGFSVHLPVRDNMGS